MPLFALIIVVEAAEEGKVTRGQGPTGTAGRRRSADRQVPPAHQQRSKQRQQVDVAIHAVSFNPSAIYCEGPGTINSHATVQDGRFHGGWHLSLSVWPDAKLRRRL